jgi:signal transduction histidine kinase
MKAKFGYDHLLIFSIFIAVVSFISYNIFTGNAWVMIPDSEMAFLVILVSSLGAALGGVVATYSFIAYMEKPELRFLILALLGFDAIFVMFAFLFSHPSLNAWLPYYTADSQRNRTIVAIFGLTLIPSVLSGSFRGESSIIGEKSWIPGILGMIVIPACVFWFYFSPEPVFYTIDPTGGFFNTTPISLAIMITGFLSLSISFLRSAVDWYRGGDRISFAFSLSLLLWILAMLLLLVLDSVLQTLEILWYSLLGAGFSLLAITMVMTAATDPHRALLDLVDNRTRDLKRSEQESEFYLNMWSHKIGNLLQGMITYVDLFEEVSESEEHTEMIETAQQISKQATLINRQVVNLSRIKARKSVEIEPRKLVDTLTFTESDALNLLGKSGIDLSIDISNDTVVYTDDLVDILFLSLIIQAGKSRDTKGISIITSPEKSNIIDVICEGSGFSPRYIQPILTDDNLSLDSHVGLELYTAKLLTSRYGCSIECPESEDTKRTIIRITFPEVNISP